MFNTNNQILQDSSRLNSYWVSQAICTHIQFLWASLQKKRKTHNNLSTDTPDTLPPDPRDIFWNVAIVIRDLYSKKKKVTAIVNYNYNINI